MTKLSVIISAFNVEKYIPITLDCLKKQSYTNFHIYIVDDCSTDNTFELICNLSKEINNISILRNIENKGYGYSYNIVLRNYSHELVTFLDADDFISQDYIENMLNFYKIHGLNCAVACTYGKISPNGFLIKKNDFQVNKLVNNLNNILSGNKEFHDASVFLNYNLIQEIGFFDSNTIGGNNTKFLIKLLTHIKIINVFSERDLYFYRVRIDGITYSGRGIKLNLKSRNILNVDNLEFLQYNKTRKALKLIYSSGDIFYRVNLIFTYNLIFIYCRSLFKFLNRTRLK
jgi:glycosyltransferase involved in cell wall biosynthesis